MADEFEDLQLTLGFSDLSSNSTMKASPTITEAQVDYRINRMIGDYLDASSEALKVFKGFGNALVSRLNHMACLIYPS